MDNLFDVNVINENTEISIMEKIRNEYMIVLDTNIYLNIYRCSPNYASFCLECLENIKDYIIIPKTVRIEFDNNSKTLYYRREKLLKSFTSKTLKSISDQQEGLSSACEVLINQNFPDADKLSDEINEKLQELYDYIETFYDERGVLQFLLEETWNEDLVGKLISSIPEENGLKQFDLSDIYAICDEGEQRYKKQKPPGFKDAKKDGIRKYSDLILWREIIEYAKEQKKNIVFVTNDKKEDWWDTKSNIDQFLPELLLEYKKETQMEILPLTGKEFYRIISRDFNINLTDTLNQALSMTTNDYIEMIKEKVKDDIQDKLVFSNDEFIPINNIGTEGVEEWEITDIEFQNYHIEYDDPVSYDLMYSIEMQGESYNYMGRDDDTKETILSDPIKHIVHGEIYVNLERSFTLFSDINSAEYDSLEIVLSELEESTECDI